MPVLGHLCELILIRCSVFDAVCEALGILYGEQRMECSCTHHMRLGGISITVSFISSGT
jgi:hypothetical protein